MPRTRSNAKNNKMEIEDAAGDSTTSEFDASDWSEEDDIDDITDLNINPNGSKRRKLSKMDKITTEEEKKEPLIQYEEEYESVVSFYILKMRCKFFFVLKFCVCGFFC